MVQRNFHLSEDEEGASERAAYWPRLTVSDYTRSVLRAAASAKLSEFGERAGFLPHSKDNGVIE